MSDVNEVTLSGRLGADVTFKVLPSGDDVAEFRLATSRYAGTKPGEGPQYKTLWMPCQWKSRRAQSMVNLLKKGQWVVVTGSLSSYQPGNDPTAKPVTVIEVDDVTTPPIPRPARSEGAASREPVRGNATPPPARSKGSDDDEEFQY